MNWIGEDRLAVRAGAGAGKTYMLVQRYLHHVGEQGLSPLEIVAVTFSEAAAAELRSRIREGMIAKFGPDDDRVAELEASRIGTFHALAASICRRHSREAETPADFSVLDEILGPLWVEDRLDLALDALPTAVYRRVPFSKMRTALRALLRDPIAAGTSLKLRAREWRKVVASARAGAVSALLGSVEWATARAYLPYVSGANGDRLEVERAALVDGMAKFEADTACIDALRQIAAVKINVGSQKNWSGDLGAVKASIRGVRDGVAGALKLGLIDAEIGSQDVEMLRRIWSLKRAYKAVSSTIAHDKRRERVLDFADLEVHALRALRHESVRAYYHERWKALLVDEYQDTNPVQAEMLALLIGHGARQVVVGDENQSIYGFRRAAPNLLGECESEIAAKGGRSEALAGNYRTHDALVQVFNCVFSTAFSGNGERYAAQTAQRSVPGDAIAYMRRIMIDLESATASEEHQSRCEAARVAEMLAEMHENGTPVHDRETDRSRPIRWSDMAVLARSWNALDPLSEALGAIGVPHVHAGGGSLLDTREARDGCALLRFLADPPDNLALAAVLKSPLFALSDLDLYEISWSAGSGAWWTTLSGDYGTRRHPFAADLLGRLLVASRTQPPSRLLHMADNECGMTAILRNLPSGLRRAADWSGFGDLVRVLERESFDVYAVSRALRRLTAMSGFDSAPVLVPRPAIEAGDAVELMSIHRAKGLEWPVVVLIDAASSSPPDTSWIHFDPAIGVAVKGDVNDDRPPCLFRILAAARALREQAELKRMAYVACTRARDYLFVTSSKPTAHKKTLHACLDGGIEQAGVPTETWTYDPADAQPPNPHAISRFLPSPTVCTREVTASPSALPVTALGQYLSCPRRFKFQYVDGHPGIGEGSSISGRVGTLVHMAIQYGIYDLGGLRRFDRGLEANHAARALAMAMRFRDESVYARYREAGAKHEVPISRHIDGITLSGRIDLLGEDFVLDFKTGRKDESDRYAVQLWLYGQATDCRELAVAYLASGELVRYSPDELHYAGEQAAGALSDIAARKFDATPSPSTCAQCRYRAICEDSCGDPTDEQ